MFNKFIQAVCLLFLLQMGGVFAQGINAQSFEEGLNYYKNSEYEKAASVFKQLETPRARLFTGKSLFSMGKYLEARSYLSGIPGNADRNILYESEYTLGLIHFQLKNYGEALNLFYRLSSRMPRTSMVRESRTLYDQILDYLTLGQRKQAFQVADSVQVKYDLIRAAFGKVKFSTANFLLSELKNTVPSHLLEPYDMERLESMASDSLNYAMQIAFGNPLSAPDGITYNIGAALPRFQGDRPEFEASRNLYFGYLMAAERFNSENPGKNAYIRHQSTGSEMDSAGYALTRFAWNYEADAVLGPLFSESASNMSDLAEQYQVPLLAPLANSDSLNTDNPYFFQVNPNFSSHGRKMAEFAIHELGMDTLAVLAERNSLGASSAFAFRKQVEQLGGEVVYFFLENLEAEGYDISEYTKHFTTDSVLVDSLNYQRVDGIYAPFTGQAASTLINLLLVDMEGLNNTVPILGSQEWGVNQIAEDYLEERTIYFSESFYQDVESRRLEDFRARFKERFGMEPNRFSMIGYDTANFLLETLQRVENPALLKNALKEQPMYNGLIGNIHFDGHHVNQEVKIFKISDQGIEPAKY